MKQFFKVLKYEMSNYFHNKVFIGVTVVGILLLAIVMFFPNIKEALTSDDGAIYENGEGYGDGYEDDESHKNDENYGKEIMLVHTGDIENAESVINGFKDVFGDEYDVQRTTESADAVKQKISNGDISCAFIMETPLKYIYYVENVTMQDANTAIADEVLRQQYIENALIDSGLTQDQVSEIMQVQVSGEIELLGKDQSENFFYTYIMIMALYMVVIMYGQMVSMNVASEKSSRAMELLITSVKPSSMMFGKVFAACIAGFVQLGALFGSAFLLFNLNRAQWEGSMIIASIFDMPLDILVYFLAFFVLGFLVYAFLYAAVSSTVSKLEDVNTVVMPVILVFVAAFLIVMPALTSGDMDATLIRVCSFVPFTSPMAMFARIAMSNVAWYEIAASIAILIGTVFGVGVLSARIYRIGVLLYGKTPKFSELIKLIFA